MIQKNNYNLEQDLHALKSFLVPRVAPITFIPAPRYQYIDWFRISFLPMAPLALAMLMIAFFGSRGFPVNGANDLASLEFSNASEADTITQMGFDQELAVANMEVDFVDTAVNN